MLEIVVNPNGASGRTLHLVKDIECELSDVPHQIHYSSADHSIRDIVREISNTGNMVDIIIVGGDGSMNEAINGIVDFDHTRIGFISCGSGNDLARSLELKKNVKENIQLILEGRTRRLIDIGEVTYQHQSDIVLQENPSIDGNVHHKFIISSGIGFDAQICCHVQIGKLKSLLNHLHMGKLVYLFTALSLIVKNPRQRMELEVDEKKYTYDNVLFMVCMNEPYEGGGFQFCPDAIDTDGKLNMCIADGLKRRSILRILPFAMFGKHTKFKGIFQKKGHMIHITSQVPLWVHTDGEVACQSKKITVTTLQEKLQLLQ